ncbi:MAG: NADH pyrophosphatase [Chloroflexi bacterium]|nr:NADH pyrophosphatase [Chloroflexota bacterium]
MVAEEVKFCLRCGTSLEITQRAGRHRPACPHCGWVFFPDPKVAVLVLIEREDKVLLVQRAHSPYKGKWTLPAGFLDAGEDPARAAEREVREETNLQVRADELIDVISGKVPPRGANILILYRGEILDGELKAGDDAAQAAFFTLDDLPPLAFEATKGILAGK